MVLIHPRLPKSAIAAFGCVLASLSFHPTLRAQAAPIRGHQTAQRGATHDSVTEAELRKRVESTADFEKVMTQKTRPVGDVRPAPESSLLTSSIFLFDGQTF